MNIILLSGGSGQRLWPLSNEIRSKQFIKIFHTEDGGLESMVQRVYRQIREADPEAKITIATSKAQISSIHNQLGENVGISMEPCRRDTFPAIALAVAYLQDVQGVTGEEPVIVPPGSRPHGKISPPLSAEKPRKEAKKRVSLAFCTKTSQNFRRYVSRIFPGAFQREMPFIFSLICVKIWHIASQTR